MRVRDDKLDAAQAAPQQRTQKVRPEGLGLRRTGRHADDFAAPVGIHSDGYYHGHRDDAVVLAHLQPGRVDPQIGPVAFDGPLQKGVDLGVDVGAKPRHFALRYPRAAHVEADAKRPSGLAQAHRPNALKCLAHRLPGSRRPRLSPPCGAARAGWGSRFPCAAWGSRDRWNPPASPMSGRGSRCAGRGDPPSARPWQPRCAPPLPPPSAAPPRSQAARARNRRRRAVPEASKVPFCLRSSSSSLCWLSLATQTYTKTGDDRHRRRLRNPDQLRRRPWLPSYTTPRDAICDCRGRFSTTFSTYASCGSDRCPICGGNCPHPAPCD